MRLHDSRAQKRDYVDRGLDVLSRYGHLKPNVGGIGLNVNAVLDGVRVYRQQRKNRKRDDSLASPSNEL